MRSANSPRFKVYTTEEPSVFGAVRRLVSSFAVKRPPAAVNPSDGAEDCASDDCGFLTSVVKRLVFA